MGNGRPNPERVRQRGGVRLLGLPAQAGGSCIEHSRAKCVPVKWSGGGLATAASLAATAIVWVRRLTDPS
jgi:hypothetical protein